MSRLSIMRPSLMVASEFRYYGRGVDYIPQFNLESCFASCAREKQAVQGYGIPTAMHYISNRDDCY
jgi:hypothetical protein